MTEPPPDLPAVIATCQRLAETQRNLPVPMTGAERDHLREAARLLRTLLKKKAEAMTYTYAILEISPDAFNEIAKKLRAAGYDHSFHEDGSLVIDMHGIALKPKPRQKSKKKKRRVRP